MKSGEERQGKEKGANWTAFPSQGGADMIFKLSQLRTKDPTKGIQNLLLKVGYVIGIMDQYIEWAARVITSEVLKLSPCSILRGSTDICRLQTKKVSYQYSNYDFC
jgi:hypothetical protein